MIPTIGNYVKIYLRNGFIDEGIVEVWDNENIVISNDSSYTVIVDLNDIFLFKISKSLSKKETPLATTPVYVETPDLKEYHRDPELRNKSLVELHNMRASEERANVRRALTEFKAKGTNGVQYGEPGYRKREKSIFIDPSKKD